MQGTLSEVPSAMSGSGSGDLGEAAPRSVCLWTHVQLGRGCSTMVLDLWPGLSPDQELQQLELGLLFALGILALPRWQAGLDME